MRDYILFLQGPYYIRHLDFYRKLCRSRRKVAVDGGFRFFKKSGLVPDLLIGDLDSLKGVTNMLSRRTEVVTFPQKKNKIDSQLAIEHCIEQKARRIDIVVPAVGEVDHFMGNLMLLSRTGKLDTRKKPASVRIINIRYEAIPVDNGAVTFRSCVGDVISVIPISRAIRLTCSGTEYRAKTLRIERGHSVGMRNCIASRRAVFRIEGKAVIIRNFSR